MTQALFTSMTGLNAGTEQLTVVSDNVANMNTTAYKTSRVDFQDIWYKTKTTGTNSTTRIGGTNPYQIGVGVKCASISKNFDASTVNTTGRATDLAITGNGWFTVLNADGKMLLTRDGTFALDENGYLCTANGFKVLGCDSSISMANSTIPIKMPTSIKVDEYATKNIDDTRNDLGSEPINFNTVANGELNALGTTHNGFSPGTFYVTIGDKKVQITLPDSGPDKITSATTMKELVERISKKANQATWQDAVYDGEGHLVTPAGYLDTSGGPYVTFSIADGDNEKTNGRIIAKDASGTKSIKWESGTSNFVAATNIAVSDKDPVTGEYMTKVLNYTATIAQMDDITSETTKMYESFSIGQDGTVTVTYSDGSILTVEEDENATTMHFTYTDPNGYIIADNNSNTGMKPLYVDPNVLEIANMQLQIAKVTNDYGLVAVGNNQYSIGVDCGDVIYTKANLNGVGGVTCGALETSNVDLAEQFAYMILAQRLVQANSQVFQGANQMLQTLSYLAQ